MKYYAALVLALGLASASPVQQQQQHDVKTIQFTLQAGPVSQIVYIPADGKPHPTNTNPKDLNINIVQVDTYGFDAIHKCTFYTPLEAALVQTGPNQIDIGPPQPITAISCWGW